MAVKLTSTGIQYSSGNTQSTKNPRALVTAYNAQSGAATYSWTSIPDHKRLELSIFSTANVATGPIYQTITVTGSGGYAGNITGVGTYNDTAFSYSNQSDLLYYSNYHTIPTGLVLNMYYVGANGSSFMYNYYCYRRGMSGMRVGTISVLGKIVTVTVTTGATATNFTGQLHYKN